jgi:protease I
MSNVLMIIPPERFRDEELFITHQVLEEAGHETVIASSVAGICQGSRGGSAVATLALADVHTADYDAVVFVGGGGAKLLYANPDARRIAREMGAQLKVVAAICLAPVILANAGLLQGRAATVAGTEARTIESQGARYTGPGVTVDGHIVTANAPKASRLFAQRISELLSARR